MKKVLAALMAGVMIVGLTACGSESNQAEQPATAEESSENIGENSEEPIKAVMVSVMSGGEYWGPIEEGFLKQCEEYGWQGEYWAPVNVNDGSQMVELIESAVTQGYKVISTCITDPDIFSDVLTRAKEAGCILIANTAPSYDLCDTFIGVDQETQEYEVGIWMGEYANEHGFEQINFMTMQTMLATDQNANHDAFIKGFTETFKGEITDLGQETCESNAATAQDKFAATYTAHPEMNLLAPVADNYGALGAGAFITDNNLQGKVLSWGPGSDEAILEYVENGSFQMAMVGDYTILGERTAMAAYQILNGEELTADQGVSGAEFLTLDDLKERGLID